MLKEHENGSYNFKWIRCINYICVAVGRPDLFNTELVNSQVHNLQKLKIYHFKQSTFFATKTKVTC